MFNESVIKSLFYFLKEDQVDQLNTNDIHVYRSMKTALLDYQSSWFIVNQYINMQMELSINRSIYLNQFIIWYLNSYLDKMDLMQKINFILFMNYSNLVNIDLLREVEYKLNYYFNEDKAFFSKLYLQDIKRLINLVYFYQTHYGKTKTMELLSEQMIEHLIELYLEKLRKYQIFNQIQSQLYYLDEVSCYNLQFIDKSAY